MKRNVVIGVMRIFFFQESGKGGREERGRFFRGEGGGFGKGLGD